MQKWINSSLVPRFPPYAQLLRVTFELVQKALHEFKGHAIIARKGGSLGTRLDKQSYE